LQPGDAKYVTLVSIGGSKIIRGGSGLADGPVNESMIEEVMKNVISNGFGHEEELTTRSGLSLGLLLMPIIF
jgi:urease